MQALEKKVGSIETGGVEPNAYILYAIRIPVSLLLTIKYRDELRDGVFSKRLGFRP
jgi:hypothetical protein